jgi:Ca2+-binding EF-hand superfamily protein
MIAAITLALLLGPLAAVYAGPPRGRDALKHRARVDTPAEARIDKDKDGKVEPAEVRAAKTEAYLKNRAEVDTGWEKKADSNGDGKVGPAELRAWRLKHLDKNGDGIIDAKERLLWWQVRRWKVDTELEKKYDKDGDGWLSGEEARDLLRDRWALINTNGKAKVDSAIEKEYDADGDGVIDKEEAGALKDALGI